MKQSVSLAGQLKGISVSSHNDFTFVLHVAPGDGDDKQRSKGDIILLSERYGALCAASSPFHFVVLMCEEPMVQAGSLDFGRVIEIVTRVYMAHRKVTNGELSVAVSDSFEVSVDRKGPMTLSFDRSGITEVSLGHHTHNTIQSVY